MRAAYLSLIQPSANQNGSKCRASNLIHHYNYNPTHSLMLGTEHIYAYCTLQHPIVRYLKKHNEAQCERRSSHHKTCQWFVLCFRSRTRPAIYGASIA